MVIICPLQDADGSVPFFWGTDSEEHLVLSDDVETVKKGCGKSFAPFPKGSYFVFLTLHLGSLMSSKSKF